MSAGCLRVGFCLHDSPDSLGGPYVWARRLLPALNAERIELTALVFTPGADTRDCSTTISLKAAGVACRLCDFEQPIQARVRWILEQSDDLRLDVLVANFQPEAWYAVRWLRQAGIAVVGVMHSDDAFYAALIDRSIAAAKRWQVDGIVAVSSYLTQVVRQRNPSMPVWRIPCGVPMPDRCINPPSSRLRIAYVGRLIEYQKRISTVAAAFCRVARTIPGTECLIIGDGPERSHIEALIDAEGCADRVHVTGRMEPDALAEMLANCHVITLLSDYEGVPIALMEAMALGLVPVCLQIRSGIPELVEHERTGLLLQDRDQSFDAAIRKLSEEPLLWQQLSHQARDRIRTSYSLSITLRQWLDCLHEAAAGCRPLIIPREIKLPPPHPSLHWGDQRRQRSHATWRQRLRLRFRLGMLRQHLAATLTNRRDSGGSAP